MKIALYRGMFKKRKFFIYIALFFAVMSQFFGPQVPKDEEGRIDVILEKEATTMSVAARMELSKTIRDLARDYQLDPLLILALIKVESHFSAHAESNRGALGLMQIKPIVVKEVAREFKLRGTDYRSLLFNEDFNVRIGVHYFAQLRRKFRGDKWKTLLAYNRGPTSVARQYRDGEVVPQDGYQYKVMNTYRIFTESFEL